jgi:hypothetical protein
MNYANNYSKYKLGIYELFNPEIHGFSEISSSPNICGNFLVYTIIHLSDFYSYKYMTDIIDFQLFYYNVDINNFPHPIISQSAYTKLVDYYKNGNLSIIECEELSGMECVAYDKTIWLKIFQRKWKSYYKKLQEDIQRKKQIKYLMKRELNGK